MGNDTISMGVAAGVVMMGSDILLGSIVARKSNGGRGMGREGQPLPPDEPAAASIVIEAQNIPIPQV